MQQYTREELIEKYGIGPDDYPQLLGMNRGGRSYVDILKNQKSANIELVDQYDGWLNLTGSGKIDIYHYQNNGEDRYIAEFWLRIRIDDVVCISYVFSEKPTEEKIIELQNQKSK